MLASWDRPNGLNISRVRGPIGVIGIIYESRPNVTADAGALCVRAANAAILRGGSESALSSAAIAKALSTAAEPVCSEFRPPPNTINAAAAGVTFYTEDAFFGRDPLSLLSDAANG